jgi:hypothetical protein
VHEAKQAVEQARGMHAFDGKDQLAQLEELHMRLARVEDKRTTEAGKLSMLVVGISNAQVDLGTLPVHYRKQLFIHQFNYIPRYLNQQIYGGHRQIYGPSGLTLTRPYIRGLTDEYRGHKADRYGPPIFIHFISPSRSPIVPPTFLLFVLSRHRRSLCPCHRR